MAVSVLAPSADLAPLIRAFVHAEIRESHTQILIPETGIVMALRFAGEAEFVDGFHVGHFAKAAVAGLAKVVRRVRATENGGVILVLFREQGAARVFAAPLDQLHGTIVALENLTSSSHVARLQEKLASAHNAMMRVAVVESFLRERLRGVSFDPIVDAAVRAIHTRRGALRIAPLARKLGISHDRLQKRFRCVVGASPKQLASIIRFRHVLAIRRSDASFAQLAHSVGFCDQSHFIRDFRVFTGTSPADFFRTATFCPSFWDAQTILGAGDRP